MRALLYLIKRVIIVEFDAIPVHFSFRISLSHGTKSWCQDIQSDEPHASVCVYNIFLIGLDGRWIKPEGLRV